MTERTSHAPGTPSWVDLGTDVEGAKTFYGSLLGWETLTLEDAGGYGFFLKGDKTVAGFGPQMNPGPPFWSTYVTVADLEASVAAATGAGGTVVVPPMDVMTAGRMTVLQDPQGGFVSLWQPLEHIGAQLVNEPGALCWNELQSRDVEGSKAFYGALFGWGAVTHTEGPFPYTEFQLDGQSIAGMLPMPPMVPAAVPTYWLVYFAVDSIEASIARAEELGATKLMGPMEVPAGTFSVFVDPQGATFALIQLPG